jgi:symplekin
LDPNTAPLGVDDDDDDYEPDFQVAEDTEQILNKLDNAPSEEPSISPTEVALGPFKLPSPPPLTTEEAVEMGQSAVSRIFSFMQTLEESASKKSKAGFNRLAASTYDRDAWINIITRIATRAPVGLEAVPPGVKQESELSQRKEQQIPISDTIRESLYNYILEDFRKRIDIAVSWLVEEWYVEKCQLRAGKQIIPHYEKWALRVLDGILPYLDARDKFLTRFLSEIPELNIGMLERVKGLCRDPVMVNLAVTSLLYLVMMKPPARKIALDAVEDIWKTCKCKFLYKRDGFQSFHR